MLRTLISGCSVEYQGEPVTRTITAGTFELRGEAQDEATISMKYTTTGGGSVCSIQYTAQLTLDSGVELFETLAEFAAGDFLESVERDEQGNTWLTSYGPSGAGVFKILDDSVPNGITADMDGNLYVADNGAGRVFLLEAGGDTPVIWAEGGLLAPLIGDIPGPNGIKVYNGSVYVSNMSQLSIVRIPILDDGSAGKPEKIADGIVVDDFAFDAQGRIWATTHPFNSIVLIRPDDGTIRLMYDYKDGIWGPCDVIFGADPNDAGTLYVVGDGNIYGSAWSPWFQQSPDVLPPKVLRIDAGVEGAPVPGDATVSIQSP